MPDIVSLGELLIDFTSRDVGVPLEQAYTFDKNPGGAPANVAAGCASLGADAALITKVGDDSFGRFLLNAMRDAGVDDSGIVVSGDFATQLAFVSINRSGKPDFDFHVHDPAHENITVDDLDRELIQSAEVFHFGSLTLRDEPSATATLTAAEWASEAGVMVSYDPNYREDLWPDEKTADEVLGDVLGLVDVLKVNETELRLLSGTSDAPHGLELLLEMGPELVSVTLGPEGCVFGTRDSFGEIAGVQVHVVDTTGCGDAFVAATLMQLLEVEGDPSELSETRLNDVYRFANAAAAFAATAQGAIPAMPNVREVRQLLDSGI